MIKFSALNELSSSDEEDGDNPVLATREAQEEEAYSLYNRALKCRTLGEILESQNLFRQVLEKQFIVQAKAYDEKNKGPLRPALTLKYLVYKNLASIAFEEKDYKSSMESYLEAMTIDATDVNMWYKMGMVAWNLPNYVLSRLCFEEGLKCNSNHWPCLDKIITVMYTLNDYANCLYYISQALEKECYYLKGLVFKDQIYKEDPSLRAFCEGYFRNCDPSIHTASYGQEEAHKLVQESLDMREIKRSLYKPHDLPVIQLKYPIKEMRWKAVGESLIYMYDYISSADPIISMGCRIDISQYINTQENVQTAESEQTNIPAMISLPEANCTSTTVSGNTSTSQAVSQKGLLPLSLTTEKGQEALASDKQVEIENEESHVGLGANISADVHTENRPVDQVVFPDTQNINRTPKRKRFLTEITDLGGKRRSSRVRNTATKRPQDSVNYQELLQKFLPSSLLGEGKFDDQDDDSGIIPQGKNNGDHNYGQTMDNKEKDSNADVPKELKLCFLEREDICSFIANNQNNGGIIDLFYKYVVQLGRKSNFLWPRGLSEIYLAAFTRLRKHITMPNLFSHDSENKYIKEVAEAVLFFIELKVDHWYANKGHCSAMSPTLFSKTNAVSPSIQGVHDFMGKGFHSDFEFLLQMTVRLDILGSDWLVFTVRTLWLKAKFFAVEGDIDKAVFYMEKLMDIIKRDGDVSLNIVVPNCSFLKIISSDSIRAQLESLQRCQSLEEVQRLYENEEYLTVVDLLVVTFNQPHTKGKVSADGGIPERHAQLILLQDSLWKLQNYSDCVRWSEVSFNEAIQQYMNASTSSARSDWADTISCLLSGLDRIIKMDRNSMSYLEEQKLIRLTQNLIGLVSLQMEHYDYSSDQSALTILPWVILYRLIYNEELKIKTLAVKSFKQAQMSETKDCVPVIADENDSKIKLNSSLVNPYLCSGMPSSLMLLFKAHECLGRRSWCCAWEGALLLLSVDVIMEEIQNYPGGIHPYHEDLEAGLEQCFYCLYGHPNKRTKAKHLQEHSVPQITLTWERALQIFQYFRPATLPEFDSYRTSTVSVEFENLLRRISMLVPPEEDPTSRADGYIAYIEGGIDKCPSLSLDHLNPSIVAKDLYYLLGDYYFKSKEFGKAIRFYLLDICINPDRLDSWAGMALSRSSQLDHKLCSYELKKDALIYRKASAALRCFEHALKINPNSTSLWIEYGSLAYILHSHASRQLKQDGFGEDIQELLRNKKIEMLNVAHQCFIAANSCHEDGMEPEEVWLHHYMLGKIAEKCQEDPEIYLNHYEKALNYLHADNARYPRKIQYHNPPELSIEALEVYYRLHASCLKYLLKYENTGIEQGTLKVIRNSITAVASGPFANFQENQEEEREEPLTFSRSGDEKIVEDSHPYQHRKYVTDHNYYGAEQVYQNIEVQLNSYGNQGHPASSDLSSDFQDDAIIKELLDSIVSVISEHFEDAAKNSASDGDADFLNEGGLISNNHLNGIEADDVVVDTLHNVILPCIISSECEALEIDASGSTCDDLKVDPLTFGNLEKQILVTTSDEITGYQKTGQETNPLQSYHEKAIYLDVQEDKKVGTMLTDNSSSRSSGLTIDFKDTEYLKIKEEECNFYGPLNFIVDPEVIYVIDDLVSQVDSLVRLGNIFKFSRMVKDCNSAYGNDGKFKESGQGEKIYISQNLFRNPKSVKSALNHTDSLMHQKSCMNETNNVSMQNNFGKGMLEDVASFSVEAQMANSVTTQSHSEFMTYQEVNNDDTVKHFHNMLEKTKPEIEELVKLCMNAMRECLQRYVQHFKSLFRMAHYYCFSNKNKNLQWAREILLAATPSVSRYSPLPGLFAERKNTNFFNGIWHVPSNEIDRAGSFGAHMYRSVFLLIDVLWQQRDYNMLLYLTQQLHRTPDFGKKYMRDTDRTFLATESYRRCITILREQMNSLLQEEPPPEESRLTCCLLEIYRSCQTLLKAGIYPEETNELLSEAYSMYKLGEVDPYPSVLEQAIKFCQLQLGKSFPTTHETSRYVLPNKLCAYPTDEANTAVISSTSNCYTPDAWQREFAKSLMLPILPVPVEGQAKSDCHGVGKSVLIIPVTNNTSVRNGTDSCFSKCVPLSNNTQMANVEKSSNENLQTCSLAYLPLPPTFSSGKIACSSNNTYQENATVLSCQALECYDIFATLMKASGYHATPHTPSSISADSSSQSLISKQKEL